MKGTPTFLYPIFGLETTTTCPRCDLGTKLRKHNFELVHRFTTHGLITINCLNIFWCQLCYVQSTMINISKVKLLKEFNCCLILFILMQTGTLANREYPKRGISSVSALFVRKINNFQVQIDINLKTVNCFKYKMEYSLVIVSMCIE